MQRLEDISLVSFLICPGKASSRKGGPVKGCLPKEADRPGENARLQNVPHAKHPAVQYALYWALHGDT